MFAARCLAAWYCYFAGVPYPWGRFSPALLSRFRSWQWQPDGPSRVQAARLARSLQTRDDNERCNLCLQEIFGAAYNTPAARRLLQRDPILATIFEGCTPCQ